MSSSNISTHKSSGDHDSRYYTESEVNNLLKSKISSTVVTNISWTNQIVETGIYIIKATDQTSASGSKYFPYDSKGNKDDGWIIEAVKINGSYTLIHCYQYNAATVVSTRRYGSALIHHNGTSDHPIYWYSRGIGVNP